MANFNVKEGLSIQGTEIVDENRVVRNATLNASNSVTFQNIPNTGLVNDGLTVNGYDIDLGGTQVLDTDDIQESGTPTNIYFTTPRARAVLSVNQTGGDGTLAYNSGTGVFAFAGASAAETRVHFSATTSTGATYNSSTGVIALASIPNAAITNSSITINGIATSLGAARTLNTDDVQEDPSPANKYFTEARVRAAVTVTPNTGLSFNSGTGVFELASIPNTSLTYPYFTINNTQVQLGQSVGFPNQFTDDVIEDANPANKYFTAARARAEFSGGTGVTYDGSTGEFSIGQAVAITDDVTFNDLTLNGDLIVAGTTTTLNTETIQLADNTIVLNSNATGGATEDSGIEIERGDDTNKTFIWDETNDRWTIGSETFVASTVIANLTGNVTGTTSDISNHDTDSLTEGSNNLYYTTARFDTAFATKNTDDLSEGSTNVYYTSARFDTDLATKDTGDLTEGTNLYYTNARADARVALQTGTNLDLSQKTSTDLTEGTNLYFTDARADARVALQVGANLDLNSVTTSALAEGSNLYYTDARADARANDAITALSLGTAATTAATDYATAAQGALADTATQPGDLGTAATTAATDYATAAQGTLAASATQPGDLGTAATTDATAYATAAQGTTADSALQAETIDLTTLKAEVAAATDFADFQTRIAAL